MGPAPVPERSSSRGRRLPFFGASRLPERGRHSRAAGFEHPPAGSYSKVSGLPCRGCATWMRRILMELQQDLARMSLPTQPRDGPWPITISTRSPSEKTPEMMGQGPSYGFFVAPSRCGHMDVGVRHKSRFSGKNGFWSGFWTGPHPCPSPAGRGRGLETLIMARTVEPLSPRERGWGEGRQSSRPWYCLST